jgi:hypothetical protein
VNSALPGVRVRPCSVHQNTRRLASGEIEKWSHKMSICAGDWMRVRVGTHLQRHDDPRHTARVEAIHNSAIVKLRWLDTRWFEFVSLHEAQNEFHKVRS